MSEEQQQFQREYFRKDLEVSLCADMTIVKIRDAIIETKQSLVCIRDIGPGGLKIQTNLKLPVTPLLVLEFETVIIDEVLKLQGHIVRRSETSTGLYEYGVKFTIEESLRTKLIQLINEMLVRLRRAPTLSSCRFCHKCPEIYESYLKHNETS